MIIKNKHDTQVIWVTNKDNEIIFLNPWQECEVEDLQGRWYLANYSHILQKVDINVLPDNEKDEKIAMLSKQVETLTKLVNRLTWEKKDKVDEDELTLIEEDKKNLEAEANEKIMLVEFLKAKQIKWVWNHRSIEKLREAKKSFDEILPENPDTSI